LIVPEASKREGDEFLFTQTETLDDKPRLHVGVVARAGRAGQAWVVEGLPAGASGALREPVTLSVTRRAERGAALTVAVDPGALSVEAGMAGGGLHYFRLADATLRPLPPAPPALRLARGDAYVAVLPGAVGAADGSAIARFLHLRDYFNAEKLARAVLGHMLEVGGAAAEVAVVIVVVEAR
jgi:hypothetical protein